MEFYKLAGIGDIGEIVVHMDISPEHDKRGVIGLGEPPAIPAASRPSRTRSRMRSACACRQLPLTPDGCWPRWTQRRNA